MQFFGLNSINACIDAIYPPRCCVCNGFLDHQQSAPHPPINPEARMASSGWISTVVSSVMCRHCSEKVTSIESPLCPVCGAMFVSREGVDHCCGQCQDSRRFFQSARAVGLYRGSLMTAIHQYKYHHRLSLCRPLGEILFLAFARWYIPDTFDLVVPVPLHRLKLRERGFNQSYLLIRNWRRLARKHHIVFPREKVRKDILIRIRKTISQTKLSRQERLKNIKNAFALTDPVAIQGKQVLVVDDVYTTGATVNECARVLTKHGAARVDILTLARVS